MLLGDAGVGKTSSIKAYMDEKLKRDYISTIGVDVTSIKVPVIDSSSKKEKIITLSVWDLAGQDRFQMIRKQFYQGGTLGILIFDVTKRESFNNLSKWIDELQLQVGDQVPFFLVGNKIDLPEHVVTLEEMKKFQKSNPTIVAVTETSALTGEGIRNLFKTAGVVVNKKHETGILEPIEIVEEKKSSKKQKKSKKSTKKSTKKTTKGETKKAKKKSSKVRKAKKVNPPKKTTKKSKKTSKKKAKKVAKKAKRKKS